MRLRLFAAAMILVGSLFAADPGLLSLAIPNAQVIAGINLEQVRLSPFGQYLLSQGGPLPEKDLQKLIETTGFDPRRDLREILVSSDGQPGGNQVIALARGAFDIVRILEAARADGQTIDSYKGVSIIARAANGTLAFPDSTLAMIGNADAVHAAIDRISAPAALGPALALQVNELSTTEDVWFVSSAPISRFQPQAPGATGTGAGPFAMLNKAQQESGGLKFGANVVLNLQAVMPTGQDAAALAAVLKAFAGMGDLYFRDVYAPAGSLLKNLNVTSDGPVTKVSSSAPESLIEEMIKASHVSDTNTANNPQPRTHAAQPPALTPQRIRVGSKLQERKLLQHSEPVYPPLALQARISGVVHLNAIIGKDGTVENLTVASGHPLLVPAALEAVKQWLYQPTLLNGQPVEVVTQIEVNFALSQ